jgi:hypothetical protein
MSSLYSINQSEDMNNMHDDNTVFSPQTIKNLFLRRSVNKTGGQTGGANADDDEYKLKYYKYKTKYLKSVGKK